MRQQINIADEHKKILTEEFGVTHQTVRMVLLYVNNSKKARAMRRRAKELLLKEAEGIILDESDKVLSA